MSDYSLNARRHHHQLASTGVSSDDGGSSPLFHGFAVVTTDQITIFLSLQRRLLSLTVSRELLRIVDVSYRIADNTLLLAPP